MGTHSFHELRTQVGIVVIRVGQIGNQMQVLHNVLTVLLGDLFAKRPLLHLDRHQLEVIVAGRTVEDHYLALAIARALAFIIRGCDGFCRIYRVTVQIVGNVHLSSNAVDTLAYAFGAQIKDDWFTVALVQTRHGAHFEIGPQGLHNNI